MQCHGELKGGNGSTARDGEVRKGREIVNYLMTGM